MLLLFPMIMTMNGCPAPMTVGIPTSGKQGKAGPTLQNACWGNTPNPPGTRRIRRGCASPRRYESTVSSPLAVLFFLGAAALNLAHNLIHVGLDGQQLPHLLTGLPVIGIGGLFLRQEGGVLGL